MDILELVEQWIAWHAVRNQYSSILHRLSNRSKIPLTQGLPQCALEACVLQQIMQDRDIDNYDMGMAIVIGLYKVVSNNIRSSILVKILDAMKVVVLFDMLRTKHAEMEDLLAKLNHFFPRANVTPADMDLPEAIMGQMTKYRAGYRSFFFSLLSNPAYCANYLRTQYKEEFGTNFEARLTELVLRIVTAVKERIPLSPIEKILQSDPLSEFITRLYSFHQPAIELLLDTCTGKDTFTELNCLQLLKNLRPSVSIKHSSEPPLTLQSSYYQSLLGSEIERESQCVSSGLPTLLDDRTIESHDNHDCLQKSHQGCPPECNVKRKRGSPYMNGKIDSIQFQAKKRLKNTEAGLNDIKMNRYSAQAHDSCSTDEMQTDSQNFSYPKGQVYRMKSKKVRTNFDFSVLNLEKKFDISDKLVVSETPVNESVNPEEHATVHSQGNGRVTYEIVSKQEMENKLEAPAQSSCKHDTNHVLMSHADLRKTQTSVVNQNSKMKNTNVSGMVLVAETPSEPSDAKNELRQRNEDSHHPFCSPEQVDFVSSSSSQESVVSLIHLSSQYISKNNLKLLQASSTSSSLISKPTNSTMSENSVKTSRLYQHRESLTRKEVLRQNNHTDPSSLDKDEKENSFGYESQDSSIIEVVSPGTVGSRDNSTSFESCLSYVASSELAEDPESMIQPSSYFCDKFDAIVLKHSDITKATLPALHTHLRPSDMKNCIVKLHENKTLERLCQKHKGKLYS